MSRKRLWTSSFTASCFGPSVNRSTGGSRSCVSFVSRFDGVTFSLRCTGRGICGFGRAARTAGGSSRYSGSSNSPSSSTATGRENSAASTVSAFAAEREEFVMQRDEDRREADARREQQSDQHRRDEHDRGADPIQVRRRGAIELLPEVTTRGD